MPPQPHMLRNRLFYTFKPLIPRPLQIFLRRQIAMRKRERYSHIWPIDPAAAKQPKGWQGWPEGRKFALLLCHDVDTQKGHDNCMKLAKLEAGIGFRSFFNFVPDRYKNSNSLHSDLRTMGFAIGVHGCKHDGKLFASRKIFNDQAAKINSFLIKWKTEGFTAPSMLHNLDWIKSLNISYSTSTFDTDPFEPQPDGARTIFPFPVYRNSHSFLVSPSQLSATSYRPNSFFLELPYTMPQDHLLFIILQEKNIDIWKQKLDWIAAQGGMALLITHADYMNFNDGQSGKEEYPVTYYTEFLNYVRDRYKGQYWNVLPGEVVSFWNKTMANSEPAPERMQ